MFETKRYIGVDASGSLSDRHQPLTIIATYSSDDVHEIWKTHFGRSRTKSHSQDNRSMPPSGAFNYVAVIPEQLALAKKVYKSPRTGAEITWNGSFYEFRLLVDAHIKLLETIGFDSGRHIVVIDPLGKPDLMREEISEVLKRHSGCDIPKRALKCETNADNSYWAVRNAHNNALRLFDRYFYPEDYPGGDYRDNQVLFDANDMVRFEMERRTRHEQREMRRWLEQEPFVDEGLPAIA